MQRRTAADRLTSAGQIVAILLFLAYATLLLHKGVIDLSAMLRASPGAFWPALGRHLLRILGGG